VLGAEGLVRGAARLAARTGLSQVVIGLTVVAFGTSAPELAVSVGAAINREADLAIGNVVGSNIANVLLVLGLAALVGGGLAVAQRIVRVDVPIVIGASVLVFVFGLNGELSRIEGIVLLILLAIYLAWTISSAKRGEAPVVDSEYTEALDTETLRASSPLGDAGLVLGGLVLLVVGAQLLVSAATDIAEQLGVSQLVIGLTVVAVGTSLPELATAIIAAMRGHADVAFGNIVGSNTFNVLGILGATALVKPVLIPGQIVSNDVWIMLGVTGLLVLFAITGWRLIRAEGVVFLAGYAVYVAWLGRSVV
jgi:cation:H+ antiporter